MYIDGWAYKPNEKELMDQKNARYKEISHLRSVMKITVESCYKNNKFHGHLETAEQKALSEYDIALLADHGNLCFGGSCTISGDRFHGTYNTD